MMVMTIPQANASLARKLKRLISEPDKDWPLIMVARMVEQRVLRGWLQRTGLTSEIKSFIDEPLLALFWKTCECAGVRLGRGERGVILRHYFDDLRAGIPKSHRNSKVRLSHEFRKAFHQLVSLFVLRAIRLHRANGCTIKTKHYYPYPTYPPYHNRGNGCGCHEVIKFGHSNGRGLADDTWSCDGCMETVVRYNYAYKLAKPKRKSQPADHLSSAD